MRHPHEPRRCPICGSPLFSGEVEICTDCELDRDFPDLNKPLSSAPAKKKRRVQ